MKHADSLAGKVAIVTGAGDGIGRAVCLRLALLGATVFGASRREESLVQTSELLRATGADGFLGVPTDVTQEDQVCSLFAQVAKSGPVDILVNNAGAGIAAGLLDITLADWDAQMAVNARGVFLCSREAARHMLPRGSGEIINLSSLAGKHASAGFAAYVASKHAAVGFTEAISRELRRSNIRITSLCPGAVATEMRRKAAPNENSANITQPEQIATLIGFILTEGAGMRDMGLDIF